MVTLEISNMSGGRSITQDISKQTRVEVAGREVKYGHVCCCVTQKEWNSILLQICKVVNIQNIKADQVNKEIF